jgi:hypothetical protein
MEDRFYASAQNFNININYTRFYIKVTFRTFIPTATGLLTPRISLILSFWSTEEAYPEFWTLGYNAMWSSQSQQTYGRNMSPPSSGFKPSKKPGSKRSFDIATAQSHEPPLKM